jgi:hypothetical protein
MADSQDSFSLNSYDLAELGVTVLNRDQVDAIPKPDIPIYRLAGADGSVSGTGTIGPRVFRFQCVCEFESGDTPQSKIADLAGVFLAAVSAEVPLGIGWLAGVEWNVRLTSAFTPRIYEHGLEFALEFTAPNPAPVAGSGSGSGS